MALKRILVVDDDVMVHQLVTAIIQVIGDVEVVAAFNGREALDKANQFPPDLIVSDVNMPDMDGLALTGHIRQHATLSETPILLLTARSDTQDKYHGFLHGADDYLVKPFALAELLARLRAIVRRAPGAGDPDDGTLEYGDLRLDLETLMGERSGRRFELTRTEFLLLELFMRNPDRVLTREVILDRVWGMDARTSTNGIEVYVGYLRRKLESGGEPRLLQTVRGFGYALRDTP